MNSARLVGIKKLGKTSKMLSKKILNFIQKRHLQIRKASSATIYSRVEEFGTKNGSDSAIFDEFGRHTYGDVSTKSDGVARALTDEKVFDKNVSFLCPNNSNYVFAQFGIW
jgi:acyl-CoA synthetase (AMP-forming)/AMP-acid ligase II